MSINRFLHILLLIIAASLLSSCANPGSGPDGGPYDETPPKIIGMSPAIGQRHTTVQKISIMFDELIKMENASEKVVVSPPQIEMPEIKPLGRRISVTLLDSLKPNTTYTIDFSDAIMDSNEGNPLGNFTYFFSTGEQLDTMEVSGNVLAAENLEPVKGILVGLHSDTTDTAFVSKPFDRVARTDGSGRFSIKGVAPGAYRVFALKDMDGDFRMSRGEMMAALAKTVRPSSYPDVRQDTVWRDTVRYDSIRTVHFTHYIPDDLVLLAYTPANDTRFFLKSERPVAEWFRIYFTAPSAHIPVVKGLNFDADTLLLQQRSPGNDTITYWLRDISVPVVDTLKMSYTYETYDDSLRSNVLRTDTLELTPRKTMAKRRKEEAAAMEKWQKQLEKRHKKGDFSNETPPQTFLMTRILTSRNMSPVQNPAFTFDEPIVRLDTSAIHLRLKVDTLYEEAPFDLVVPPAPVLQFSLRGEWRYGQQYELVVDSAAFTGLSGHVNEKTKIGFSIGKEESYGAIFLTLPGADSTATIQLLTSDTKVYRQVRSHNGKADLFYIEPGDYYLRLFYDHNGNGRWDTGNYSKGISPEEVFYFPTKMEVRANWDINQTWDVNALPLTRQKPSELIKQKADKKRNARNLNEERERNKR